MYGFIQVVYVPKIRQPCQKSSPATSRISSTNTPEYVTRCALQTATNLRTCRSAGYERVKMGCCVNDAV